jgi:hypothetical protein
MTRSSGPPDQQVAGLQCAAQASTRQKPSAAWGETTERTGEKQPRFVSANGRDRPSAFQTAKLPLVFSIVSRRCAITAVALVVSARVPRKLGIASTNCHRRLADSSNGFSTSAPKPATSATLRVANVIRCILAVAARSASTVGTGRMALMLPHSSATI